jgi:hypothetical protein
MKRLTLIAVLTSAAALAASHSETTTYVDGNIKGVSPNTGGTLVFAEDKTMYFRTGLDNVAVPYAGISKVELGAVKETSHNVPLYKVWALHKRLNGGNKSETQLLIVSFKNDDGEDKSMTLELAKPAMDGVLSTLEKETGKSWTAPKAQVASTKKKSAMEPDARNGDWWGDDYWKTTRNADKWKKAGSDNNNNQ